MKTRAEAFSTERRNPIRKNLRQRWIGAGLLLCLLLFFTACMPGGMNDDEEVGAAAAESGEDALVQVEANESEVQDSPEDRQLVIWAPDFWVADEETPAGQVVGNAIVQFGQIHDGAIVEIHTKAESGSADMLSTLRSAQRVAPAILPDALLINTQDVWPLAELGLAQPLTETLELFPSSFYPFAEESVRYNDAIYGIPYAADLLHASAVDPLEPELPADWDALLGGERRYLFPADGQDGALSLLLQFIGIGGTLSESTAAVDVEQLEMLYEFYATGVADGVIPADNMDFASLESTLKSMDTERADLFDTSAGLLLRQSEMLPDVLFAPAPTKSGRSVSMAQTWAFVILTEDPGQRTQVLDLVGLLLEPGVHGDWSKFTRLLPTTNEAAGTWDASQPYSEFLLTLLGGEETYAVPNGRTFAELLDDMQIAQQAVLSGQMTPEEAANSVRPAP